MCDQPQCRNRDHDTEPADLHSALDRLGLSTAVSCFDTVADAFHAALAHPAVTAEHAPTFPMLDRPHSVHCSLAAVPATTGLDRKGIAP
nr:hypothetical protein JVH1_3344 [Rhodococcus sp. JVH1]